MFTPRGSTMAEAAAGSRARTALIIAVLLTVARTAARPCPISWAKVENQINGQAR